MDESLHEKFMERYKKLLQEEKEELIREGKTEEEAEKIVEAFS